MYSCLILLWNIAVVINLALVITDSQKLCVIWGSADGNLTSTVLCCVAV
jgi:hypothetical protein